MEIKFNTQITVDSDLSTTSENPVQNKVVTQAINDNKVTVDSALSMTSVNPVQNKVIAAALANITPSESNSFTFWVNESNSGNQTIITDKPVFVTYFESGNLKGVSSILNVASYKANFSADPNTFVTVYHKNDITTLYMGGFNIDVFDTNLLPKTIYYLDLQTTKLSEIKMNDAISQYYLTDIGLNTVDTSNYVPGTQNDGLFYADKNNISTIDISGFSFMEIRLNNNHLSNIISESSVGPAGYLQLQNNLLTEWNISSSFTSFDISNNKLKLFDFTLLDPNMSNDINISNNDISELDGSFLSSFFILNELRLSNNPFLSDQQQAEIFANSLMEGNGSTQIYLSSSDTYADTVKTIAESKGWIVYIE